MAEKEQEKDPKIVEVENVEATELEDADLDEVGGGTTDTNCICGGGLNDA